MMTSSGSNRRPVAEINVTPLVDVVLVLLIIFMVTAPFLQGGLEINLPKVATKGLDVREGLIISIRSDKTIAVGDRVVSDEGFEDALRTAGATERPVFLKADTGVPYGEVVKMIARMRHVGVASLGLVTQPPAPAGRR